MLLRRLLLLRLLMYVCAIQHELVVDVNVRAQTVLVLEQLVTQHAVGRTILIRVSDTHVL